MKITFLSITRRLSAYLTLTKPTIMLLVVITGAAGLVLEGSLTSSPLRFSFALTLLALAGGSANAFNQAFERNRDAQMERTRRRRPLPQGAISTAEAFAVAGLIGVVSVVGYWVWFNPLSALLSAGTILFYALFYTIYLKPRTTLNIVIGGAAGAMAPVIGWAAGSGTVSLESMLLFLIIFLWTPPHFWSLALCLKEDYRKVGLPMLPIVAGDAETWRQITWYVVYTIVVSITPVLFGAGVLYAIAAAGLGAVFLRKTIRARKSTEPKAAWGLFGYSVIYILALFTILITDHGLSL